MTMLSILWGPWLRQMDASLTPRLRSAVWDPCPRLGTLGGAMREAPGPQGPRKCLTLRPVPVCVCRGHRGVVLKLTPWLNLGSRALGWDSGDSVFGDTCDLSQVIAPSGPQLLPLKEEETRLFASTSGSCDWKQFQLLHRSLH